MMFKKKESDKKEKVEKRNKSSEKVEKDQSEIRTFSSVEEALKEHSNTLISKPNKNMSSNNITSHHSHSSSSIHSSNCQQTSNINSPTKYHIYSSHSSNLNSKSSFFIDRDYIKNNFDFIRGENLIDYDGAYFRSEEINFIGTLVMTDFRLLFKFKDETLLEKMNFNEHYFKIPFFHITKIDKSSEKKNITKYSLDITTKDARLIKFIVMSDQLKLFANLNNLVFPKEAVFCYTFAYKYREALFGEKELSNNLIDGWQLYDPLKEYARQGIKFDDEDYKLRLCNLNKNYNLCSTYPDVLIVPKALSDEEIKDASLYRTKNRFPVLSYVYSNNNNLRNSSNGKKYSYASIWRSSQTKSGLSGQNRSQADEKLLKTISQLNDKLIIYDARPYINALANRIKGGGFENVNNYFNTELYFCEIENIHNARNSLNKLWTLCNNKIVDNKKFWSTLEQTDWYDFIHLIIKYSNEIAISIKKNYSVLVHCSDGWDRSSQLISLSEILIDPYYRTLEGVVVLIEKEWSNFGHQFAMRNGIYMKETHEDQRAPIFLQWLDCLHQLITQFPNAFEYNMEFILFIASQCNSNLYGTFLYNCQQERVEKESKNKTVSIWTDVYLNLQLYKNPFYQMQPYILTPNYSPYKLRFWEEFFLKWNNTVELNKIYLDHSKNAYVKTSHNYFVYHKLQDNLNVDSMNNKMNELVQVLIDVYNKTAKTSIFEQFNETTKFYLSNTVMERENCVGLEVFDRNKDQEEARNSISSEKENLEEEHEENGD